MTERTCSRCGATKPIDAYYKQRGRPRHVCKTCAIADVVARQRELVSTPEGRAQRTAIQTRHQRRKFTGCTQEQYDALYALQNGACAICEVQHDVLCADHDHVTGRIRGLLCKPCNLAIGNMLDRPDRLRAAALYLERD